MDTSASQARFRAQVVVLDYSGHPCQVQLSRTLAGLGHEVTHMYCSDYSTGRGNVEVAPTDPPTFQVRSVSAGVEFNKYNMFRRIMYEIRFARAVVRELDRAQPDSLIVSNVPLLAHALLTWRIHRRIPIIFWQQDIYSHAITVDAVRRMPRFGRFIGWVADRVERYVARSSRSIVAITEAFCPTLSRWGIADAKTTVVPNWAALDEMPMQSKINQWSLEWKLDAQFVVLYTGTLGLKHDPSRLLTIAEWIRDNNVDGVVVVISEGVGRRWLEVERDKRKLADHLWLLDYQPYESMPNVLAAADVLVVLLEPEAGVFSVPSKTLNYLCAGRPVLGIMPSENLAARTIAENDAGIIIDQGADEDLRAALTLLWSSDGRRRIMGENGRAYAEREFDIASIVIQFEQILKTVTFTGRT